MDYQAYRARRDQLLASRPFRRLDCMNPAKALGDLAPPPVARPASVEEALAAWRERLAPGADPGRIVATTGVRPALRALCQQLASSGHELWLPADVYPEYQAAARQSGVRCREVLTLPAPNLAPLAGAARRAAFLVPQPLAPLGRPLTENEVAFLRAWLAADPARRLVLDTVYHLAHRLDAVTRALWEEGQTWVIHSLAKSWLLPEALGVVLAPPDEAAALGGRLVPPSPEAAGLAATALRELPNLPHTVAAVIEQRWAAQAPAIRTAVPDWRPPATGYFSLFPISFEECVERWGMMTVPASVFGSSRSDLSVISCLYGPA